MKFKCPKCGCDTAEEVLVNCTVSMGIDGIADDGYPDYNGTEELDGGVIDRYQCCACGYVLEGVTTQEEFVEYVKEKCK